MDTLTGFVIFAVLAGIATFLVFILRHNDPTNVDKSKSVDPDPVENVFALSYPASTKQNNDHNSNTNVPPQQHLSPGLTVFGSIDNKASQFGRLVATDKQNGTVAALSGEKTIITYNLSDSKYEEDQTIHMDDPVHHIVFLDHLDANDLVTRLLVVTGEADARSGSIYANKVSIFRFKDNKWVLRSTLENPLETTVGYRATFGDTVQIVRDDNLPTSPKISVYIRGSRRSTQASGTIYYYSLNPSADTLSLNQTITDNYLLRQSTTPGYKEEVSPQDYLNGFGRSFYVTSGLGLTNLLIVGNPLGGTNDTYSSGYVQVYTWNDSLAQWVQPSSDASSRVPHRLADPKVEGFGHTVAFNRGYILIVPASEPVLYVYDFQRSNLNQNSVGRNAFVFVYDMPIPKFQQLYPSGGPGPCSALTNHVSCTTMNQYAQTLLPIGGRVLYTTFINDSNAVLGFLLNPSSDGNKPFESWAPETTLFTDAHTATTEDYLQKGQSVSLMYQRSTRDAYVYIGDPLRNRILIYVTPL